MACARSQRDDRSAVSPVDGTTQGAYEQSGPRVEPNPSGVGVAHRPPRCRVLGMDAFSWWPAPREGELHHEKAVGQRLSSTSSLPSCDASPSVVSAHPSSAATTAPLMM